MDPHCVCGAAGRLRGGRGRAAGAALARAHEVVTRADLQAGIAALEARLARRFITDGITAHLSATSSEATRRAVGGGHRPRP